MNVYTSHLYLYTLKTGKCKSLYAAILICKNPEKCNRGNMYGTPYTRYGF